MSETTTARSMEAKFRTVIGSVIGIVISLSAFYMAGIGVFDETLTRVGLVALGLILMIVVGPLDSRSGGLEPSASRLKTLIDLVMVAAILFSSWHFFAIGEELEEGLYDLTHFDQLVGLAGLLSLLEMTRRMVGLPLTLICIGTIGYALFGEQLPWIFRHAGFYTEDVMTAVWYSFDGVYGRPVAVVTSLILIFVVFGAILEGIGAGEVLLKLAFVTTGKLRGGPAHAAVVASALFCSVSVEARRVGIEPVETKGEKLTTADWLMTLTFVIPLVVVGALVAGRSVAMGGFLACLTALGLGFVLNPDFRRNPQRLLGILASAGRASAVILVAVAAVGIIIGVMNQTGLGLRFANVILAISGESLFGGLAVMMLGCLVLGMGMPTVPAYLIIVLVVGPAIAKMGVPVLLVHLFAVYFGVLSSITPPVALAAYAAAPITGASPMATAVTAVRIALIGFIVPFVFIYNPSLSLVEQFDIVDFIWICARLGLAIWLLTTGMAGFEKGSLSMPLRVLRVALGVLVLFEGLALQAGAFILGLLLVAFEWRPIARNRANPA